MNQAHLRKQESRSSHAVQRGLALTRIIQIQLAALALVGALAEPAFAKKKACLSFSELRMTLEKEDFERYRI